MSVSLPNKVSASVMNKLKSIVNGGKSTSSNNTMKNKKSEQSASENEQSEEDEVTNKSNKKKQKIKCSSSSKKHEKSNKFSIESSAATAPPPTSMIFSSIKGPLIFDAFAEDSEPEPVIAPPVQETKDQDVKKEQQVLFCICATNNEYGFFICCDDKACQRWFHPQCLQIPEDELELIKNNNKAFYCPNCLPKHIDSAAEAVVNKTTTTDVIVEPICDTETKNDNTEQSHKTTESKDY